jgi:hypothetical protein
MIARVVWIATLAIVAVKIAGLQLDRQTRRTSAIAQGVPELFRSAAQFPIAANALAGPDPVLALSEAEKLVSRRPMPAEHLRVLAQAQFAAGEYNQGPLTIQYAAQRGWRDPLAQESMLRLALSAGDKPEAARRYAALFLRRDTQDELLEELGQQVLAEPEGAGRTTLVDIVSGGERWHNQFMNRGARVMPPDAFTEIVRSTIAHGARYDCGLLEQAGRAASSRDEAIGANFAKIVDDQC